ncbi:hypothetical protein [Bradyrhizobium sp. Leo170]|uniref:hypothetical protein n=1 Tax=Bradyrhizobium sp. Leo170 TaxID=1571199 RepID=UPI0013EE9884|nr:hypothetical protein [Bradyrhizobium sp. Leo170]
MDFAPEWPLIDRLIVIVLSRPKFRKRFGSAGTAPLPFTAPYERPKKNPPP